MVTDGSPLPEGVPAGDAAENAGETAIPDEPRFATGQGQVPPVRPPDPIRPFIRPPGPRRRPRDWPVLVFALVVSALVMAVCCMAGFAVYTAYTSSPN